ncbi:RNA helicase [Tulasnella sp. 417]|nr:RNA helicase [Tulasnella sp. 417]
MSDFDSDDSEIVFESSEQGEVLSAFDGPFLKDELTIGFETPSSVQQKALLPILSGRHITIQGGAGMGKTSTIAIAILQSIDTDLREVQAIVLSPTRELATHAQSVITTLGNNLEVQCHAFVGGTPIREDIKKLDNNGVHVISGTPGRVLDMVRRKKLRAENIKMLVLEEADEMLEGSFREQVYDIYRYLPPAVQVVSLGITFPEIVLEMTTKLVKDPTRILVEREDSTLKGIKQYFVIVKEPKKFDSLFSLFDTLTVDQAVVFCSKSKVGALELDEQPRD